MKIDKYFHLYGRKDDVVFEEIPAPSAQPDPQECEKCIFKPFKQFQPERKKGKWIVHMQRGNWNDEEIRICPNCRKTFRNLDVANYCPNCGLPMEMEVEE